MLCKAQEALLQNLLQDGAVPKERSNPGKQPNGFLAAVADGPLHTDGVVEFGSCIARRYALHLVYDRQLSPQGA